MMDTGHTSPDRSKHRLGENYSWYLYSQNHLGVFILLSKFIMKGCNKMKKDIQNNVEPDKINFNHGKLFLSATYEGSMAIELLLKFGLMDASTQKDKSTYLYGHNLPEIASNLEKEWGIFLNKEDRTLLEKLKDIIEFKGRYPERRKVSNSQKDDLTTRISPELLLQIKNLWIKIHTYISAQDEVFNFFAKNKSAEEEYKRNEDEINQLSY